MIYNCCDENRKAAVLGNPTLNGIDYLEVLDFDAEPLGLAPQTILLVHCLKAGAGRPDARQRPDHRRRKHHRHHGNVCHAGEHPAGRR